MIKGLIDIFSSKQKLNVKSEVVADLDAILVENVGFKLHGKEHIIKPLTVEQFMLYAVNLSEIYALKEKSNLNASDLIDKYHALISSVCSTVKRSDIEQMSQQQVSALFELIVDTVSGKLFVEKKKTNQTSQA